MLSEFEANLRSCPMVQSKLGKGHTNNWVSVGRESMPTALVDNPKIFKGTNSIVVSPNPSEGVFKVSYLTKKPFTIEVYNLNNQLIHKSESHNASIDIDLSPYDRGMYYIKINNDVEKIIKH